MNREIRAKLRQIVRSAQVYVYEIGLSKLRTAYMKSSACVHKYFSDQFDALKHRFIKSAGSTRTI
jgi:hypothetical protein